MNKDIGWRWTRQFDLVDRAAWQPRRRIYAKFAATTPTRDFSAVIELIRKG